MRKGGVFFSIRYKILLSILSVILILGVSASIGVWVYATEGMFRGRKDALIQAATNRASELEQLFDFSKSLVVGISQWPDIQSYLDGYYDGNKLDDQKSELLEHFAHQNISQMYDSIYLLDLQGKTLVSLDRSFEEKNYGFRDYFQRALHGEVAIEAAIGKTSKKLGFYFSSPVYDSQKEVIGVVVVKLNLEAVQEILTKNLSSDVDLYLVDEAGFILSSDAEDKVYNSLVEIDPNPNKYGASTPQSLGYILLYEEIKKGEFPIYIDQKEDLLIAVNIEGSNLFLVEEEDSTRIRNVASFIALFIGLFVLGAAVLAMLIILFLVGRFLAPIKILNKQIKNITKGDFSYFIKNKKNPINTKDEFQFFSKAVHDMAVQIYNYQQSLEKQVKSKTADLEEKMTQLEKLNRTMVDRELKMIELKKELKKEKALNEKNESK